jgi:hypothetical protein
MSAVRAAVAFWGVVCGVAVVAAGVGAFLAVAFTERASASHNKRTVFFRGEKIAVVDERVSALPGGHSLVERVTAIDALDEKTTLTAELDPRGFVVAASYSRPGERSVVVRDGSVVVDGVHRGAMNVVTSQPIVLLELAHRLRVTERSSAVVVELSSLEAEPVTIERQGARLALVDVAGVVIVRAAPAGNRTGPGAFAEGDTAPVLPQVAVEIRTPGLRSVRGAQLRSPVSPPTGGASIDAHRTPTAFVESDDSDVAAFARPLCQNDPLQTARLVGEAVAPLVDANARARAPSARRMLDAGGDCDGAAALAVAAMRACGHPARAVVGYRLLDPGTPEARLVPHAIAEVYRAGSERSASDGAPTSHGQWWRLDPTVRQLIDVDDRFLAVAEGLGGALSMGRVLGVVDAGDVVFRDAFANHADDALEKKGPHVGP